jgi:hypothetical protein
MGRQMRKVPIAFLILAVVIPVATPSWAVINNGGGKHPKIDPCKLRYDACVRHCAKWYGKGSDQASSCEQRTCFPQYTACVNPAVTAPGPKPGNTKPIINGKPVEAPPPPKGSNPTNAAPITNNNPTRASPNSGGGGGRLK